MFKPIFKIFMFLALFLASCTTIPTEKHEYDDPVLTAKPHRILAGEQVKITVFGQADLSSTYKVDDQGRISMPLLGIVSAHGNTPQELAKFIAQILSQNLIRNPSVAVEMEVYTPIYITGAVRSPGQFTYIPGLTAAAAIASAGGFLKDAKTRFVRITRREGGKVFEHNVALQTPLAAGDIIQVFGPLGNNQQ